MAGGNWMPEMVEIAGGIPLFAEAGKHSPWISWELIAKEDPDKIVILPCGFSIERILEELHILTGNPLWNSLNAVQNKEVYITDGNQYFNRPGPRAVESIEIMAEIFHPTHFKQKHYKTGWISYEEALNRAVKKV